MMMQKKQKYLWKEISARTAEAQPFFAFLAIIDNFSLGLLWKSFHKKFEERNGWVKV
jgi:hypothetical protein